MNILTELFAKFAGSTKMVEAVPATPTAVTGSTAPADEKAPAMEASSSLSGSANVTAEPTTQELTQADTLAMLTGLHNQILTLQGEMQKLQVAKVEEIKAVEATVDVIAEAKAKQIMLTETGIDMDRLPKLADVQIQPNVAKLWEAMPSATYQERLDKQKYFETHYDEIMSARSTKK